LFAIIDMYAYFVEISQGCVKTHWQWGGMCNNHVIAYCLQRVLVKKLWKSTNNWWRYAQK